MEAPSRVHLNRVKMSEFLGEQSIVVNSFAAISKFLKGFSWFDGIKKRCINLNSSADDRAPKRVEKCYGP